MITNKMTLCYVGKTVALLLFLKVTLIFIEHMFPWKGQIVYLILTRS